METRYKAATALAISVAGAVGTLGVSQTGFLGGMVHNGFLAATIGGLADWFAVTALFRKPLGISYRTEIIIRNRQRIMQAVVDFAADDLLGTENIMRFVHQQDLSQVLKNFLAKHGKEAVLPHVVAIGKLLEERLEPERAANALTPVVRKVVNRDLLEKITADALSGMAEQENATKLLHILAACGEELLADGKLRALLNRYADDILQEYGQSGARGFAIGLMGLSGKQIADALYAKAKKWLTDLTKDPAAEASAVAWLGEKLRTLSDNEEAVQGVVNALMDKCSEESISAMLAGVIARWQGEGVFTERLQGMAEHYMEEFLTSPAWQEKADAAMKEFLAGQLAVHHDVLASLIEERLGKFSDEELVRFTEEKVADDLQMIRINGSVVGSLVGMCLYAVVHLAGQVLGP